MLVYTHASMLTVTEKNYPLTHEVLSDVSHDAGYGAGHVSYSVPRQWEPALAEIEAALGDLSRDDRQTLAIGEETEAREIAHRSSALVKAGALLEDFWNDWEDYPV